MVDAVAQYVNKTSYAAGLSATLSTNTSLILAAAAAAKGKDAVVVVLGTDLTSAHEEMDAANISIPAAQLALLAAVTKSASVPVTVVMMTAVPLDLTALMANPKVGAIVHAGQPSVQQMGVGDVLFGGKVPAGRTIQTVYPEAYGDEVSIFDFNMRPGPSLFPRPDCSPANVKAGTCPPGSNPGRTYRFYTGKAVISFGFGLSYTTFKYSVVSPPTAVSLAGHLPELLAGAKAGFVSLDAIEAKGPAATFEVQATNTGDVDADDVVLGFITPPGAGRDGVAIKTLFGFERVHVPAGQTVSVYLYPEYTDFSVVDASGVRTAHPGEYTVSFGIPETRTHDMGYAAHTPTVLLPSA